MNADLFADIAVWCCTAIIIGLLLLWLIIRTHTHAFAILGAFVGVLGVCATVASIAIAHSDAALNASPQASTPPGDAAPATGASSASSTTETTGTKPSPLKFTGPTPNERVGKNPLVTLNGDVPEGRRLWIFVRSGQELFVQGPAEETLQGWSFDGVTLGGDTKADIGLPYTIMAVLADNQADAKLLDLADKTAGDKPVHLPQGATTGPKVIVLREE